MIPIRIAWAPPPMVTVVYRRTAAGSLSIAFAADLVRRTGASTLHVLTPPDPTSGLAGMAEAMTAAQRERIYYDVSGAAGTSVNHALEREQMHGIVVDCGDAVECEELDTLYPRQEAGILARGEGPVLIPFGDSIEAVTAAERGFALAKALGVHVVLYHTTWKDDSLDSTLPETHMCSEAREVCRALNELAQTCGVACKTVVETADDVVEGIVRCALRESARLLVMSRSSKTTVGCYVDQALIQSPVPLLAIAALDRRRA